VSIALGRELSDSVGYVAIVVDGFRPRGAMDRPPMTLGNSAREDLSLICLERRVAF